MPVDHPSAPGREQLLDEVIAAYLEAEESGAAPDRREWLARYPEIAPELAAFFGDEEQFDSLMAPLRTGTPRPGEPSGLPPTAPPVQTPVPGDGAAQAPGPEGRSFGDYEVLEEIARGGMGVVYRARQVSLNRLVALKVIRSGRLAHGAEVQRFRLEAEAAARLDHPNIVPIYDVGEQDGVPYFTMKLVEGGNLAQRIADFRLPMFGSATGTDGSRKKWTRTEIANRKSQIANLLAILARAVDYAHQRGLLHRDLKPANILIDGQGLPHVTDFGLAKWVTLQAWRAESDPAGHGDARPVHSLTESGIAVGTPNYMAPEQAAGPKKALTTAADVYSLGAILYELLTGRPPFQADTPLETLVAVLEREPARPRSLCPAVDADLETVCLKCLEKDPARRYPSARELAEDLERILAREPIQARPVGSLERLGRWCRRNAALALAGGVAVLALVAVAVGSLAFALREADHNRQLRDEQANTQRAKHETEKALRQARRRLAEANAQRALAERWFRQAHRAVGEFCIQLGERQLSRYPGLQPVRRAILQAGVNYYKEFLRQKGGDPRLRKDMADTLFRLAFITAVIGTPGDALRTYEQALDLYEQILRADPASADAREGAARTSINLGILQRGFGRLEAALASYRRARDYYARLSRAHPGVLPYQSGLVASYVNLTVLYRTTGRLAEARAAIRNGLTLAEELARRNPGTARLQRDLTACLFNQGGLYDATNRGADALACYRRARAIQEQWVQAHPGDVEWARDLAVSCQTIGNRLCAAGKTPDGLRSLEEAGRLLDGLHRANPRVPQYARLLADVAGEVGQVHERFRRNDAARERYRQACSLREELARRYPGELAYRTGLGSAYTALAGVEEKRGRPAEALRLFQKALPLLAGAVAARSGRADYRADLSLTLYRFGTALARLGRTGPASAVLRHAVEQRRAAMERASAPTTHARRVALYCLALSDVEMKRGLPAAAVRALRESLALVEGLTRTDPRHVLLQCDLSDTLVGLGDAYRAVRQWESARACYVQAGGIRGRLICLIPTEPHFQGALGVIYLNLATVHAHLRRRDREVRFYEKARDTLLKVAGMRPDLVAYRRELCVALHNLGLTLSHLGERRAAAVALRQAVDAQQKLIHDFPKDAKARQILGRHYSALAGVLRADHRPADVAAVVRQWRQLDTTEPRELYLMARELALAAKVAAAGKAEPTPAESAESRRYGDEAMDALREAVRRGFRDAGRLEKSPDFAALRPREDFQTLVAGLKK
jgi:serine/threonine-protein kinase